MLTLQFLRGLQGAWNDRAISDHGEIRSRLHDSCFAEWDHVIGTGIRSASVGFAVEAFVLQKQNRVVAADGGAQQSSGIERVGWEHDSHAGSMREDALATLRVVDRASGEITADGNANDHGRRE